MTPEWWVSPLFSAGIVGLASWVAVKTSIVRLTQRMDDRDEEYSRRLALIEARVGLGEDSDDHAAFTRREASQMERTLKVELQSVNRRLTDLDGEVREVEVKVDEVLRRSAGS